MNVAQFTKGMHFVHLSVCLSVCLSVRPPVRPSVRPSVLPFNLAQILSLLRHNQHNLKKPKELLDTRLLSTGLPQD